MDYFLEPLEDLSTSGNQNLINQDQNLWDFKNVNIFSETNNILNLPNNEDFSNFINPGIFQNTTIKNPSNNKKLGRKNKGSLEIGEHGKNAIDNMTRKIKVILKNDLKKLLNLKIDQNLDLEIIKLDGKVYAKKDIQLLNIKQEVIIDTSVDAILKFLNSKIREFFSEDISTKIQYLPSNFNALLINKIYSMEDTESITSILDKTGLECLKYYRKDEDVFNDPNYKCLKGLEKGYEELKNEIKDEKYADQLINLIKEFEVIYASKNPRKKKVKYN